MPEFAPLLVGIAAAATLANVIFTVRELRRRFRAEPQRR